MSARRNSTKRIVFSAGQPAGDTLVPEILEVGHGEFGVAEAHHLHPHSHSAAFEICLITSGEVEWEAVNERHVVRAGDLFVTQPGQMHWGRDGAMQPCTLFWLILDARARSRDWLSLDLPTGDALRQSLERLPRKLARVPRDIAPLFEALFREHVIATANPGDRQFSEVAARAVLHQLLVAVGRCACDQSPVPQMVERAIQVMRAGEHGTLSVSAIAEAVGEEPNRLKRQFLDHVGMTMTQFSLRERIRLARSTLVQSGKSVTEIANELGFSSSQHFATTFKRLTGDNPRAYRQRALDLH